jgi:hypothetical protein
MSDTHCERCHSYARERKMSFFNTDMLCKDCQIEEEKHPSFEKAKEKEASEIRKGNYNYPGVGLPDDLKKKYEILSAATA